jgi:hypothetical protein
MLPLALLQAFLSNLPRIDTERAEGACSAGERTMTFTGRNGTGLNRVAN